MVRSRRKSKVQLPLADERLEVLIPESIWLPMHHHHQGTEGDEPPCAKLQHNIAQHLTIDLALRSGLSGVPSSRARNAWDSGARSSSTGKDSCSEIRQPSGSRVSAKFGELAAKFGELGTENRVAGPKNVVWGWDRFAGEVVNRTPPTGGLQQAGLGQVLKSFREIEWVLGREGT
jgi:hypothetical protein